MTYLFSESNEDQEVIKATNQVKEHGAKHPKFLVDIGAKAMYSSNSARLIVEEGFSAYLVDKADKARDDLKLRFKGWPVSVIGKWVTSTNVNDFVPNDTLALFIDVDGQDYHLWSALKVKVPVVCIEYIGWHQGHYVMPKIEKFDFKAGPKEWGTLGASEDAIQELAAEKGYSLWYKSKTNLVFIDRAYG